MLGLLLLLGVLSNATITPTAEEQKIINLVLRSCPNDVTAALGWQSVGCALTALRQPRWVDIADYFCGSGAVSMVGREDGLRAIFLDNICDPNDDLSSTLGFVRWIQSALSIKRFGYAVIGFPCQTFVWISLGHTKRSKQSPYGNVARDGVYVANILFERIWLTIRSFCIRGVYWVLESPLRNTLWTQPLF